MQTNESFNSYSQERTNPLSNIGEKEYTKWVRNRKAAMGKNKKTDPDAKNELDKMDKELDKNTPPPSSLESKEKLPHINTSIGLIYKCATIEELLEKSQEIIKDGKVDTIMLTEFNLSIGKILDNFDKILNFSKTNNITFILAPNNTSGKIKEEKRTTWFTHKEETYQIEESLSWKDFIPKIEEKGIIIPQEEKDDSSDTFTEGEAIGLYISPQKQYAFPKNSAKHPLHIIPETRIAISICRELSYINPKNLDNIDIIYNPSREGDDPYLRLRNEFIYRNITKEQLSEIIKKNILEERKIFQEKDSNDFPDINKETEERVENIITGNKSPYVQKTILISNLGIPIIRCDGEKTTGIISPPKNKEQEGTTVQYKKSYCKVDLKIKKN